MVNNFDNMNGICVNTKDDVLRERFIYGAELTGKYGFPQLPPINASADRLRPVPFNSASKEKHPADCLCHFFIDDNLFERLWNNPQKYFDMLGNFKYIAGVDFSFYDDMPVALQIYQVYRSRALSWWLTLNGMDVIPVVGWGSADTYDFCFDGLPIHSTLIVSTNRCFTDAGKHCYIAGFREMARRLEPFRVLVVGRPIETGTEETTEIIYLDSFGQELTQKLRGCKDGQQIRNE